MTFINKQFIIFTVVVFSMFLETCDSWFTFDERPPFMDSFRITKSTSNPHIHGRTLESLSNEQSDYLSNTLSHFENMLQEAYDSLEDYYELSDKSCTFYRACEDEFGFGVYPSFSLTPDSQFQNVSTNRDAILFKMTVSDVQLTETDNINVCAINRLKDQFKTNLGENENGLVWQYVGMPNGLFASYPYSDWTEVGECPGSYKPELRPWYISGSSGQKNIVLVIDCGSSTPNSNQRCQLSKEIAKKFLATLSFRDYVTVIFYHTQAFAYDDNIMMRASSDNIYYLEYFIDNFELSSSTSTNIGAAMESAIHILENSASTGDTSDCTNTIVLLTGGENSNKDIDAVNTITFSSSDPMVFSFIISPDDDSPAKLTPTQLSCETGAIVQVYTGDIDTDEPVEIFDDYISAGINNQVVRWSEIYDDAMGMGRMITATRPFYTVDEDGTRTIHSVIALDLLISNLTMNGTVSEDELLAFIVSEQVCEEFEGTQIVKETYMEENTCEDINNSEAQDDPEYVTLYPLIVTCHVIFVGFLTMGPMIIVGTRDSCGCHVSLILGLVALFIPGLIYLSTFHAITWPEIVKFYNWKEVDMTIEAKELNGYRCCDIVNCQCANTNANSCSSMKASLVEGPCGNGYYCCNYYYYSCNCYTSCSTSSNGYRSCREYCSTCKRCTKDVSNQKCQVVCGTCYTPTVTFSYEVDGNSDGSYSLFESSFSDSCGRDELSCAEGYLNEYPPIGGTFEGYYNPSDPEETGETTDYTGPGLGVPIAFGIITLTISIAAWICAFRN